MFMDLSFFNIGGIVMLDKILLKMQYVGDFKGYFLNNNYGFKINNKVYCYF